MRCFTGRWEKTQKVSPFWPLSSWFCSIRALILKNWPGLARCKVHFAVFDAMQKQGRIWENEAQTDTDSEAGIALLETGCTAGERLDELARFLLSLELQEALRQLSAEQRKILTLLFLDDLKPTEVAGRLGCTVRNVTKHRLKALDKMRQLLAH